MLKKQTINALSFTI